MVGFVAQPDSNELPEDVAVNPITTQNAPAGSFGEIAGASLNTGLTADYLRWSQFEGQKTRDEYIEPQPRLSPEDIKDQYGIDVQTPLPAYEAKYMADAQQREKQYQMATQNASGLKTFAADTTAFLADPINLGSLFVPYVGEERVAATLGIDTATLAGRAATRAVTGAGAGIVSQAPLSALKYGFSQTQGVDYGVADALKDTLYAGAAGAIAMPILGGIRDAILGKPEWAASIKSSKFTDNQAASQVGLAQMAKENPVNIPTSETVAEDAKNIVTQSHDNGTLGLSRAETQQTMDDAAQAHKQPEMEPEQEAAHYQTQADELEAQLRDKTDIQAMQEHDAWKQEQDKISKGYTDLQHCLMG